MKHLSASARLAMQDQNYDAREVAKIRNVRRKLFHDGEEPGNSDNAVNLVIEEKKRHLEEAKEKWNFDFAKGEPLPGNWVYTKLDKDENEVEETKVEKSNQ